MYILKVPFRNNLLPFVCQLKSRVGVGVMKGNRPQRGRGKGEGVEGTSPSPSPSPQHSRCCRMIMSQVLEEHKPYNDQFIILLMILLLLLFPGILLRIVCLQSSTWPTLRWSTRDFQWGVRIEEDGRDMNCILYDIIIIITIMS